MNPDPYTNKQKNKKNLVFLQFFDFLKVLSNGTGAYSLQVSGINRQASKYSSFSTIKIFFLKEPNHLNSKKRF
jgi:hypothetical protein